MKYILSIILIFFPLSLLAQSEINAGFVSGIWYSKETFFAGEEIRIYGAIQNHSGFDIDGTLRFFNRGNVIGEKDFSAVDGGLVQEWVDWKVTEGTHEIKVEVVDAVRSSPGGGAEPVLLRPNSSSISAVIVDIDTDNDGIGNKDDSDDDNDGISDEKEKDLGTDPLVPNEPQEEVIIEEKKEDGTIDEVIDTAQNVSSAIQNTSEPVLNVAQNFFKRQENKIQERIEKDRIEDEPKEEEKGTLRKFADKLPPVFRVVYLWFLKLMIWVSGSWWKVLLFIFIIFFLFRKIYRRFFA